MAKEVWEGKLMSRHHQFRKEQWAEGHWEQLAGTQKQPVSALALSHQPSPAKAVTAPDDPHHSAQP